MLRDGASAQYGSDAIAGVINLRLREAREGGGATATLRHLQHRRRRPRAARDGTPTTAATITCSGWQGLPLGDEGLPDPLGRVVLRPTRPTGRDIDLARFPPTAAGSSSAATATRRSTATGLRQRRHADERRPGRPMAAAGYQHRDTQTPRPPRAPTTTPTTSRRSIRTASCRPSTPTSTTTASGGGVKGEIAGWNVEPQRQLRLERHRLRTVNSINASLGATSQHRVLRRLAELRPDGRQRRLQPRLRGRAWPAAERGASAWKYRHESFEIGAGEPASYLAWARRHHPGRASPGLPGLPPVQRGRRATAPTGAPTSTSKAS